MTSPHQAAIALLSGGLDSTVSLAWALHQAKLPVEALLTFNYGQRPFPQEYQAAQAIAHHYKLRHEVITLDWLKPLLPQGLAKTGKSHRNGPLPVSAVWVPNRNGVLLNIAAAWAEALRANHVLFGANLDEANAGFPDNSTTYWQHLNQALHLSTQNHVQVTAPVSHLTKAQIVTLGLQLNAPFHLLWSCYENGPTHCGHCASCQLLKQAAEVNNWPPALKTLFSQ